MMLVKKNGERLVIAPIKGYGKYYVSTDGRIFNAKTGKELKSQKNRNGYLQVGLHRKGTTKKHYVHRLIIEAFFGRIPIGLETNHLNGKKSDNRLENLEVVTRSGNLLHAYEIGLMKAKKGKENPLSTAVLQIDKSTYKVLREFGSIREAERKTGIAKESISAAINGKYKSAGNSLWAKKGFYKPQINGFQLSLNFN